MAAHIGDIPEVRGFDARQGLVRIPPELDVPLTPRVRAIIDTPEFRRLAQISQLGLVSLVYPAAHHTRFEHSLGVYRLALLYLKQLSHDDRFAAVVTPKDAQRFIAAALLHDIGHWPFCHTIEDIQLPQMPTHELFAREFVESSEIGLVLRDQWDIEPLEVTSLLAGETRGAMARILDSMLSGPIDVDKMDYLGRDSLHAGVPYGRNFDQARLVGSLCLNADADELAITEKGRTAAEMMVFARYVMFSEVYWHHAVRAATAMFQRAFCLLREQLDLPSLLRCGEQAMIQQMMHVAHGGPADPLLQGLFGPRRKLYKRVAQYSLFQQPELYKKLARRPYTWLVVCGRQLARRLEKPCGRPISPEQVLLDAPPVKLEVEIRVDVYFPKENCYRPLSEVSPVIHTLARKQFDDYVKRVRVFLEPSIAAEVSALEDFNTLLHESIAAADAT